MIKVASTLLVSLRCTLSPHKKDCHFTVRTPLKSKNRSKGKRSCLSTLVSDSTGLKKTHARICLLQLWSHVKMKQENICLELASNASSSSPNQVHNSHPQRESQGLRRHPGTSKLAFPRSIADRLNCLQQLESAGCCS